MSDHNPDLTKMIALLRYFNRWRRGVEKSQPDPREVGIAIDAVCDAVDELRAEVYHGRNIVFLLKQRFPPKPDGKLPDWDILGILQENERLRNAIKALHDTAGQRMMADDPTGEERMVFFHAWKAAGELLKEVRGE